MQRTLLLFISCMFTLSIEAQTVHNLNKNNVQGTLSLINTKNSTDQFLFKEAKNARIFEINPALQGAQSVRINDIVNLQLFENKIYKAKIDKVVTDCNGNVTLTMKIPDWPMAFAIITTSKEGKSLVNISIPELGLSFGSRYNSKSNEYYLIEIDESKVQRLPMGNDAIPVPHSTTVLSANGALVTRADPNAPAVIDLLVVYTPAAASSTYVTSKGGINNVISTMVALGNTCFSNSQTGITLRLVHSAQVAYTEPRPFNMGITLDRLQNSSDGYMDNVHDLRKQYKADLVQLITIEDDTGGCGYTTTEPGGSPKWGFSVVNITQTADTYPCSAHEIGHNMGLAHGAQQINKGSGVFLYSHGWRWFGTGNKYYTSVMAYHTGGYYTDGITSQYTSFFSNPNVSYMGAPTGDAAQANAARSLREMKHVIASYNDLMELKITVDAITCNVTSISNLSQLFNITLTKLMNRSASKMSFRVGFALYNSTGTTEIGYFPAKTIDNLSSNGYYSSYPVNNVKLSDFTGTMPAGGTYRIYPVYSDVLSSPYRPFTLIKGPDNTDRYVTITTPATTSSTPPPLFDGLALEYSQGSPAVTLKLKGNNGVVYSFKVNGATSATFNPNTKGTFLIEAISADNKTKIERYIIVK